MRTLVLLDRRIHQTDMDQDWSCQDSLVRCCEERVEVQIRDATHWFATHHSHSIARSRVSAPGTHHSNNIARSRICSHGAVATNHEYGIAHYKIATLSKVYTL